MYTHGITQKISKRLNRKNLVGIGSLSEVLQRSGSVLRFKGFHTTHDRLRRFFVR